MKESCKKANATYRLSHPKKVVQLSKMSNVKYKQIHSKTFKDNQKRQYIKRKLHFSKNKNEMNEQRKVENYLISDAREDFEFQINSNPRPNVTEVRAIELFHKNIGVGPEYICTCCDQLWHRSSVTGM